MHKTIVYVAYGFLAASGTLHFVVDVLSQYLRGKRAPSPETSLYYAFNTAYALSQVLFAALILIIARQSLALVDDWRVQLLTVLAIVAWAVTAMLFIEYREPKIFLGVFGVMVVAMIATR